jgi:LysM repeat protein
MLTFHASVKADNEKSGLIIVDLMEKSQNSSLWALQVIENQWIGGLTGHQQTYKRWLWLACLLAWLLALVWQPAVLRPAASTWGQKPVLAYLALTAGPLGDLRDSHILSEKQVDQVQAAARQEQEQLRRLAETSLPIILNHDLSLPQKRTLLRLIGYNRRVSQVIRDSRMALCARLGLSACLRLAAWTQGQWQVERLVHGIPAQQSSPRTYTIFATHYDSKGRSIVALPDACLKLANGGSQSCNNKGYQTGQGYTVFIGYKGKTAAFLVGEAGPWNVDDNYWASVYDPQPRRMFADLALGLPEAQAAFFNGYNGGHDQYGRTVTAPFGIDLGDGVGSQIGLQPGANDWIEVTFMWTEGWGLPGSGASSGGVVAPLETATPAADGSVVHEVQSGQALWSIATAYQIDLPDLLALNGLTDQSIIRPGDRLVIVLANAAATHSPITARVSQTPPARSTPTSQPVRPTALTTMPAEPSATSQGIPAAASSAIDPLLLAILAGVLLGVALLLVGMRRR